jgi:hypothetical protein
MLSVYAAHKEQLASMIERSPVLIQGISEPALEQSFNASYLQPATEA